MYLQHRAEVPWLNIYSHGVITITYNINFYNYVTKFRFKLIFEKSIVNVLAYIQNGNRKMYKNDRDN